jgi:hypothetical protein
MSPLVGIEVLVLVLLGISALAAGGSMVFRPTQRAYEVLRPLTWAMVFGCLSTALTGLTNLAVMLGRHDMTPEVARHAFSGIAEMMVPIMATFAVLTVAWGLAAIGLRRLA